MRPSTGEEGYPGRRTVLEDVLTVKKKASFGQHVETGGLNGGIAETDVRVSPVVYEDEDNVRLGGGRPGDAQQEEDDKRTGSQHLCSGPVAL